MLILFAILVAQTSKGVDLNAPLDTRPTLGSEIHRGYEAIERCPITMAPLDYEGCVDDIEQAEKAKIGDADPFVLGASLSAWETLDIKLQTDIKLQDNADAQGELADARRWAASEFVVLRGLQRKLHLTDSQVRSSTGGKGDVVLLPRWQFWLGQHALEIADAP